MNGAVSDWLSTIGPLLVPLVMSWFEQRGMRRELAGLRRELRDMERDHMTRLVDLETRITKVEIVLSQAVSS